MKTTKPAKKPAAKTAAKPPAKPRPLNVRQERFAELVAAGVPATTAYRQAGYTDAGRNAEMNASRLKENEGVAARIAELRKPQTGETRKTRAEKLKRLEEIAWSEDARHSDAIAAIKVHNDMTGDNAPSKIEVDSGPSPLDAIRKRAAELVSVMDRNARERAQGTAARAVGLSRWPPADLD